jgi:hypothetical protein
MKSVTADYAIPLIFTAVGVCTIVTFQPQIRNFLWGRRRIRNPQTKKAKKQEDQGHYNPSPRQLEEGISNAECGEHNTAKTTGEEEVSRTPSLTTLGPSEGMCFAGREMDNSKYGAETKAESDVGVDAGRPEGPIPLKLGQPNQEGMGLARDREEQDVETHPMDGDLGLVKESMAK